MPAVTLHLSMSKDIQKAHSKAIDLNDVQDKMITIRNQNVILDSDAAALYGVETREINQAVKNNPQKFPEGYIVSLNKDEWAILKSKFLTSSWGGKNKLPSAFTEKGSYMLATILKGEKATATTIAIVEAFAKVRELSNAVRELVKTPDDTQKQASVMQKSGEILSDIVEKELKMTGTETSFEINLLSAVKIKHTIKREAK